MRLESRAQMQSDARLDGLRSTLTFWSPHLPMIVAVAAFIEFLCLRLLIRLGPVLPHTDAVVTITETMMFIGSVALTFAVLLLIATLTTMAWQTSHHLLKYFLIAIIALTIGLALVGNSPPPFLFVAFTLFSLIAISIALWSSRQLKFYTSWLALFVAAYLALAYPTLVNTLHLTLPFTAQARGLSELFVILATLTAPFILRPRRDWIAIIVGVIGAVLLAGLWFSVRWLPPTLMIWSVALTGYLPAPIYILAFGLWLYTFTSLVKREDTRRRALGLALIALGGLRWDLSYYALLALTGFMILSNVTDEISYDKTQRPA